MLMLICVVTVAITLDLYITLKQIFPSVIEISRSMFSLKIRMVCTCILVNKLQLETKIEKKGAEKVGLFLQASTDTCVLTVSYFQV